MDEFIDALLQRIEELEEEKQALLAQLPTEPAVFPHRLTIEGLGHLVTARAGQKLFFVSDDKS